jgi:hypothetical protein
MIRFPKPTKKIKQKKPIRRQRKTERAEWIRALDKLVSETVRKRDKRCLRCGSTKRLTCSHFWNRNKIGTRWRWENLDTFCMPCHFYHLEKQKHDWYRDFKLKQLGESEYLQLEYEASRLTKFTVNELKVLYKVLTEEAKMILDKKL